jgi:hypothetical protein
LQTEAAKPLSGGILPPVDHAQLNPVDRGWQLDPDSLPRVEPLEHSERMRSKSMLLHVGHATPASASDEKMSVSNSWSHELHLNS